jgi:tetratricopeptide (TPR) repeat protein
VPALRAQVKARDGDYLGAAAEDRAGLKFAPYNRKLLFQLALHLHRAKQWRDALTAADAALAVFPGEYAAQIIRAHCLAEVGRGAEDSEGFSDALERDRGPAPRPRRALAQVTIAGAQAR